MDLSVGGEVRATAEKAKREPAPRQEIVFIISYYKSIVDGILSCSLQIRKIAPLCQNEAKEPMS